jgi:hypothetical protein
MQLYRMACANGQEKTGSGALVQPGFGIKNDGARQTD